ncbi:unnamed protein product [Closterium sp. Naga37s-1]|nr:unnamed protein product [Closterium sp. Naga37s-1]
MSTGFTADTMDIPVPDPLDSTEDYTPALATQVGVLGVLAVHGISSPCMMSTGFMAVTMDIPVPDPLDLTEDYTPDLATQIPWERKEARAVFRGKTTSYQLIDGNWGANPRIRLHRISDAHPSLMDAHINRWSHSRAKAQEAMVKDGVVTAPRMNFTQFNAFKYQVLNAFKYQEPQVFV